MEDVDRQGQMFSWREFSKELASFHEEPCIGSYITQLKHLKQFRSLLE